MTARKRPACRRTSGRRLSPPEQYLLEFLAILLGVTLIINGAANPSCLSGCNADFWGVAIFNGVLATSMLFTLVVLLQTRRARKRAKS